MAVPFTMPENHNDVEVIIQQIQSLLTRLQLAVRHHESSSPSSGGNTSPTIRVRNTTGSSRRSRDDESVANSQNNSLPEIINNLAWLASISQDAASASSQLTATSVERSPRRRTSSECCDETKISITAIGLIQDWSQNDGSGDPSQSKSCPSSDSLLSRLVPNSFTGSLWTAMICFVGWHLFRAR